MLPNFLIIGARKAGTTSLFRYLNTHPQIYMPDSKDVHFFSDEPYWSRGARWYEEQFDAAGDSIAIGEAAPGYTNSPYQAEVPARIAGLLPHARLIYLVRHPIERMISEYFSNLGAREQLLHFQAGWESDPSIHRALLTKPRYLDRSRYAMQIEQYLPHFAPEQILVVKSEDLRDAREPTLKRIFCFLEVDSGWVPGNVDEEFNITRSKETRAPWATARGISRTLRRIPGYKALSSTAPLSVKKAKYRLTTRRINPNVSISEDTRRQLEERLRPDIERLRAYMTNDFDGWGMA